MRKTRRREAAQLEETIAFRKRVNATLLERIWARIDEARHTPEEPGSALEDLEHPGEFEHREDE